MNGILNANTEKDVAEPNPDIHNVVVKNTQAEQFVVKVWNVYL